MTIFTQPTGAGAIPASSRYGAARGEHAVPNADLIGPIDSSDEWIRQRTGIITRARAAQEYDAIDLATDAAREAIERSGVAPADIDAVIVATISNPKQSPSVSAIVADRVGANPAAAYDLNAACAGFAYGVAQADALIRGGIAKYAVVVGAEKLSDIVDPADRSISFLLGDGAGAVVVGPSDTPGIGPTVWGSDGSKSEAVGMNHTLTDFRDGLAPWPTLRQEGPTVFRWAVWEMAKVATAGPRGRRCRGIRSRRVHPPPGEHAHHRRIRQAARPPRDTSSSDATSRRPATPRPPRSRSRRTACSRRTPS